jgi:hypothetical protein
MLECFLKHSQFLCHVTLSTIGNIGVMIASAPHHEALISIMLVDLGISLVPTLKACEKTM